MTPELLTNVIGVGAGLCSMASFIPQIAKIIRDKDASGVSLGMFAVTVTAFSLWTVYGVRQGSWPLVLSNAVSLALSALILGLRLRFGDGRGQKAGRS
jgi:MtN3 and saliva related transmembrane protein